jgi:type IV secretory pathway VirJ component
MRKKLLLFCKILIICNISSFSSLFCQQLQPTKNLPIIESKSTGNNNFYVILFTGNGGWLNLAKSITSYLNSKNVSVLAINTEKYLHKEKKPAQIACDLEALIDRYNIIWGQNKIILMGYSMGAEIIPFTVNCLDNKYFDEISDLILIAPWQKAAFKDKLAYHLFDSDNGDDIYTELIKIKSKKCYIVCDDNKYSICYKPIDGVDDHDFLGGGHHFGGDYGALSKLIGKRLKLE